MFIVLVLPLFMRCFIRESPLGCMSELWPKVLIHPYPVSLVPIFTSAYRHLGTFKASRAPQGWLEVDISKYQNKGWDDIRVSSIQFNLIISKFIVQKFNKSKYIECWKGGCLMHGLYNASPLNVTLKTYMKNLIIIRCGIFNRRH